MVIKELLHSDGTVTLIPGRTNGNDAVSQRAEKIAACVSIPTEEISRIIESPDSEDVLWLDIEQPTDADLDLLQRKFGFHLLAIEDILHHNDRPKVDDYGSFVHVVFYAAETDANNKTVLKEIDLYFGDHYLVAVHTEPISVLEEAVKRWQSNTEILHAGVGALLYAVLDSVIDAYFPVLDRLEDDIETVEGRIFARARGGPANTENIEELFALRRELLLMRRVIAPARDVMSTLSRHAFAHISEQIAPYMQDLYDHVARTIDTLDTYRDLLTGAMDASLSVTSNRLNQVMKTMTAGSIILMSDSLVTGVYGMNFHNIPELSWQHGYAYALSLMVIITGGLAYVFRRAWWL
jgi:magnesium transporter